MCEVQNLPRLHSHSLMHQPLIGVWIINKTHAIACNSQNDCINRYLHKICHIALMMLKAVISNPYAHVLCKICNVLVDWLCKYQCDCANTW